jgi:hypothetical protein
MRRSKTRSPAAFSRSPGRVAEGAAPDAISSLVRPAAAAAVAVAAAAVAVAAAVSSRCLTVADRLSETKQNSDLCTTLSCTGTWLSCLCDNVLL